MVQRFLCAHAIMLSLEGIPALYIHSLLATHNNHEGVKLSSQNRTINRYKWDYDTIETYLNDSRSHHHTVFNSLTAIIKVRSKQSAFHPNATQFTLHLGDEVFGFWRQSPKRDQSIFCIHNISDKEITIPLSSINLISLDTWVDLITGIDYSDLNNIIKLKPYGFSWLTNKIYN